MADPDAEAQLLDGIAGKYGEGSDYGDLVNADEDALLEGYDDSDFGDNKQSSGYNNDDIEELDHEPEEPDIEDVLDIGVQDVELEEDEENASSNLHLANAATVSSTTQPEMEVRLNQSKLEERERGTDKFKNERQNPPTKNYSIPDSLDEVPVPTFINNNGNRNGPRGQMRGRGRGGNYRNNQMQQRNRPDNKTVLINPHFKGQVHINNEARLAWDARQRINHNKNQVGKVMPFSQNNRRQNQTVAPAVHPWLTNNTNNLAQNVPQFHPPPYQPAFSQPPQVSPWNQYQSNSFNQGPPQMPVNNQPTQQHIFMQPLPPQNVFNNSSPQFNQPPPPFNPPVFQNHNVNSQPPVFNTPQFMPPPNQFNPPEPTYHPGFAPNPQNPAYHQQYDNPLMHPPPNPQFNHPMNNRFVAGIQPNNNQFRNPQRCVRTKSNFNQGKPQFNQKMSPTKRKIDNNVDLRKKKRNLSSTNLHEVPTVDTPDTTVNEEKPQEDEDEETKAYRKQIEEQKKLRQKIWEEKEKRRQEAAQKLIQTQNPPVVVPNMPSVPSATWACQQPPKPRQTPQRNLHVVRVNQQVQPIQDSYESYPSTSNNKQQVTRVFAQQQQQNRNIKVIQTCDESLDKQHLSAFLTNRKILAKDQSLIDTSIVVISNLAAGTTDVKLRKMCQGIGDIKKLQMSPKERQATIQFNSVASAHAFFKKNQRTMLDLSMIQVALKPMP